MSEKLEVLLSFPWPSLISHASGDDIMSQRTLLNVMSCTSMCSSTDGTNLSSEQVSWKRTALERLITTSMVEDHHDPTMCTTQCDVTYLHVLQHYHC